MQTALNTAADARYVLRLCSCLYYNINIYDSYAALQSSVVQAVTAVHQICAESADFSLRLHCSKPCPLQWHISTLMTGWCHASSQPLAENYQLQSSAELGLTPTVHSILSCFFLGQQPAGRTGRWCSGDSVCTDWPARRRRGCPVAAFCPWTLALILPRWKQ